MSGSATDTIAREVTSMADLAQAIVSLARAAEKRRGARADLVEATDTIAKAIRKELRTGDHVQVEKYPSLMVSYSGAPATPETVTYSAGRVHSGPLKWADVLFRAGKILGLPEDDPDARARMVWSDESGRNCLPAPVEERQAFVHEAEAVVKAFRDLLDAQAQKFDESARTATKLTPR